MFGLPWRRMRRAGVLTNSGGAAAPLGLKTNLVAWWELNEASGNRADSHTNGLTLTDNNTVTSAAGIISNAADFELDNNECLTRADEALLDTGDIDFSAACWVKLEGKTLEQAIIGKYLTTGNQREWLLEYNQAADRFQFIVSSTGAAAGNVTVNANALGSPSTATWYYIVVWHDSVNNTINIQVNNGTVTSQAHSGGVFTGTAGFAIGGINAGSPLVTFDGLIDEAAFWKTVLTANQRTALYNGGAGLSYAALT